MDWQDGKIICVPYKDRAKLISNDGQPQKYINPNQVGGYETPDYLKNVPTGPPRANPHPAPREISTVPASVPPEEKLGSIVPTMYSHKPDTASPREIPALTTCTLCQGPVKDGECMVCSGRQCPGCGEMNFATVKSCLSCGCEL